VTDSHGVELKSGKHKSNVPRYDQLHPHRYLGTLLYPTPTAALSISMDSPALRPFRRSKSQHSLITGTGPSNSLFGRAFLEYKNLTREELLSNPLASRLKNCNSPATVLVLKEQARALGQPRNSDESSTQLRWLESTVNVLYHLSQGIEDRVGLVIN